MQDRKQIQRELIVHECARRGITVKQKGHAYVLTGVGVDLLTADLANLDIHALAPYQPRKNET